MSTLSILSRDDFRLNEIAQNWEATVRSSWTSVFLDNECFRLELVEPMLPLLETLGGCGMGFCCSLAQSAGCGLDISTFKKRWPKHSCTANEGTRDSHRLTEERRREEGSKDKRISCPNHVRKSKPQIRPVSSHRTPLSIQSPAKSLRSCIPLSLGQSSRHTWSSR
jgi:hypothetical protein